MRSYWINVGPKSNHWCPYKKETQRHSATWGETIDDRARDWSDVSAGQGALRTASNHQKLEDVR